jgi:hypothetical protein
MDEDWLHLKQTRNGLILVHKIIKLANSFLIVFMRARVNVI